MKEEQTFDLLISGGGLIGSSLACVLAKIGLTVGLIDVQNPEHKLQDGRFYAISHGSATDLRRWGIWETLEEQVSPIQAIRITQKGGWKGLTYQAAEVGADALGFMVSSSLLQKAVWDCVKAYPNVTLLMPECIKTWKEEQEALCVTLESGHILRARLLVGAEGRLSPLRESMSGKTLTYDYHQMALVCTVAHTQDHHQIAFEHFTPEGPLAFLPLQNKQSAVVWSLTAALGQKLIANPHAFLHTLIHHFGWALGDLSLVSPLQMYPLQLMMPLCIQARRTILLGDAAHVIHPLAGQGLNVGLRDVARLSQAIINAHLLGLDVGSRTLLKQVSQERRVDQWTMAGLTHGLVRLFQWDNPVLNRCAALGFWGVQHCPPLKSLLTRHAMGLHS